MAGLAAQEARQPMQKLGRLMPLLLLFIIFLSSKQSYGQSSDTWQTVGVAGFSSGAVSNTNTAISANGTVYVAYKEAAPGESIYDGGMVTVKKFNGSAWEAVGRERFSAGDMEFLSFEVDGSGTPYVAYQDNTHGGKATVMKFDGSTWVSIGSAGFTSNQVALTSLAFDSNNTPYLAIVDNADFFSNIKVSVLKFNGSAWVPVGAERFSAGYAHSLSLALDTNDVPYVAYHDNGHEGKATVMKFNGSDWVSVGTPGFSAGTVDNISLALNAEGRPYVAFLDNSMEGKATVMRFNGTSWETVGSAGFSVGQATFTSLALDASGVPYVAYVDWSVIARATVMKFNGTSWEAVGNTGFTGFLASYTSLAIDANGVAYVAYVDTEKERKATVKKYAASEPNAAPTNISLSTAIVDENVAANTVVGTLTTTDANAGDTHTYTLVAGTGAADNASFAIDGNVLKILVSPDFETKSSYSIRVRTSDGKADGTFEKVFTIEVIDLDEVKPTLTAVIITSSNPNDSWAKAGDVVTVSFTASEPLQTPTATIAGRAATVAAVGTSTTQFTASYTLAGGDEEGQVAFSISYRDVAGNEGTTVTATTNGSKVTFDNTAPGAAISSTATNPTSSSPVSLVLTFSEAVTGLAVSDFDVVNGSVTSIASTDNKVYAVDFTPTANGAVTVSLPAGSVTDAAGNENTASNSWSGTYEAYTNAAPTAIALSKSDLDENNEVGAVVGTFTSTDPDARDTHTYTLVAGEGGADNASFTIEGNALKAAQVFDYETKSSFSIRVQTTDSGGLSYVAIKTITVNDVQETITGIADEKNRMLKVYPNPASQYLSISFDRTIDSVSLVNSMGATVLTKQGKEHQMNLNLESLSTGIYTVMITSNGKVYARRIVVVK